MNNVDIFSKQWNQEAVQKEAELGGIRIGQRKPLGMPMIDDKPDDEATLQQEERMLRQKLMLQLAQMRESEANSREYLQKHGIVLELDIPDSSGIYARQMQGN